MQAKGTHTTYIPSFLLTAYDANLELVVIRYSEQINNVGGGGAIQEIRTKFLRLVCENGGRKISGCKFHQKILCGPKGVRKKIMFV
jgi:hypothetical protein